MKRQPPHLAVAARSAGRVADGLGRAAGDDAGDGGGDGGRAQGQLLTRLAEIPVHEVKRVGEKRAQSLESLGITSVLDLLTHYPRRYIDRTRRADVADLQMGEESLVMATVTGARTRRTRQGRVLVELDVDDGTGTLRVTFFNQAWRTRQLPEGTEALFFGKLDTYRGKRQLTNPVVDLVGNRTGRIVPVYPTSEKSGVAGWEFGEWVGEALRRAGALADPLPSRFRDELDLDDRTAAFIAIHAPDSFEAQRRARRRLAFDELLRLQLEVGMRRQAMARDARGIRHVIGPGPGHPDLVAAFVSQLPFPLTAAQRRAMEQINADLADELPMHRLLQGDVGSGKTVVALGALLAAVQGGHQGALMAPTEVLAEQHHLSVRALLAELAVPDPGRLEGSRPLAVALLTNRTPAAERARLHDGLRSGSVDIVVGTHALLTDEVRFSSLGVVVIDEQHRFGVEQRDALRTKGRHATTGAGADPDVLVMTATPIPRTAAMVFFGDLEVTELDELPAGRSPVRTTWARAEEDEGEAWRRVRDEVAGGNRAYVVCPLVEGSERVQARSATEERERLEAGALAGLRLGLLHGQLKAAEKEGVMEAFRAGALDVLVATTVIEVGVDVAEATVMVILDADRFGIAQLHQLRGRVGRSERPSWCYLLSARHHARCHRPPGRARSQHRRIRAGRRRSRAAGRGNHPRHAPEGAQRPEAGVVAARRPAARRGGAPGGAVDPRRGPLAGRLTRARRRGPAVRRRRRRRVLAQELTSRPLPRVGLRCRRLVGGRPVRCRGARDRRQLSGPDAAGAGGHDHASDLRPRARGDLQCPVERDRPPRYRRRRPLRRQRGHGHRSPVAGGVLGGVRRPGPRRGAGHASEREQPRDAGPGPCGPRGGRALPGPAAPLRPRAVRPPLRLLGLGPGADPGPRLGGRPREQPCCPGSCGLGDHQEQAVRGYARDRGPIPRRLRERHPVTVALFPGSFDPLHNGHVEVVERAGHLFDEVVVATLRNPQKAEPLFSLTEREEMLDESFAHLDNVRIVSVSTLVVNVARDIGATAIIRGLRAVSDFENELQMAQMNRQLSGIDTLFIPTTSNTSFVSSRLLREVARYGGDVSAFVPHAVAMRLEKKFPT